MGTKGKWAPFAGLAVCLVFAAGLLVAIQQRSSPAPSAVPAATRTIGGITWHEGGSLPGAIPQVPPRVEAVIPFGGRVLAIGEVPDPAGRGYMAGVWSSTDAVTWDLITNPDSFSTDPSSVRGAALDGRGGLYVIGTVSSEKNQTSSDVLWHSSDGATWTRVPIDQSEGMRNSTIAVGHGMTVVTGLVLEAPQWKRWAWSSTDGLSWTRTELPGESETYSRPALIAGGIGGFEIIDSEIRQAWHSDEGRTWAKVELPGAPQAGAFSTFSPTLLLASDGGLLAMGYDGGESGVPSAWTSADGRAWSRSTIDDPGPEYGCAVGCQPTAVTKVGSDLVAVGYRTQERATLPASAPIVTWVSADGGRTWHVRGSGSPGVVPLFLAPLDSDVVMLGEQLPIGSSSSLGVFVRSARGTIAWQAGETPGHSQPTMRPTPSNTPSPGPSLKTGPIAFKQAAMPSAPAEPWSNSLWYLNGRFYNVFDRWAVSGTPRRGPLVWESDDGTSWRQIANETQFNGQRKQDCAFISGLAEDGNGGLVAVGGMDGSCSGAVTSTAAAWQSADGVTWRKATIQPSQPGMLWSVAYAGGNLVAVGQQGEVLYSADHGRTWQPGSLSVTTGGVLSVARWQDGFITNDGAHAWKSSDGRAWVALGPAPDRPVAVGGVLVGVSNGLYWSSDGATWTAATGLPAEPAVWWPVVSDGRVVIALNPLYEMWITTDGKTWRDTGTKLIYTAGGLHGVVPSFCIGAGRLVTIGPDGSHIGAYYADLLD